MVYTIRIPRHGAFVYMYELFFNYCRMSEIPNDYHEQQRNSLIGRQNMRRIRNRYEALMQEQDVLFRRHERIINAKNEKEKILKILAWKWTSIDEERQSWDEIAHEVNSLMTNSPILGEIWDQIINTNVDVLLDEADRFYRSENEGIRSYNNTRNNSMLDCRIYENPGMNDSKFVLAEKFLKSKQLLDFMSEELEDLDNKLKILQGELSELQRAINPHLEIR